MSGVSKTYPGGKKCFRQHQPETSFAGCENRRRRYQRSKFALMRIRPVQDKDFRAKAWVAEGAKLATSARTLLDLRFDRAARMSMLGVKKIKRHSGSL